MQLRTVFDSNVYVAAALRPGGHADLWLDIAALPSSGLCLFISAHILNEVQRKLTELGVAAADTRRFIQRLQLVAVMVAPTERVKVVKDDPDDDAILECALAAQAQLIVSADHHLLNLSPYGDIGVTHPRELKRIFASDFEQAA